MHGPSLRTFFICNSPNLGGWANKGYYIRDGRYNHVTRRAVRFEYRISVYLMRVIEPPQPIVDRGGTVSEVHPCSHGVGRNRIAEAVVYEDT